MKMSRSMGKGAFYLPALSVGFLLYCALASEACVHPWGLRPRHEALGSPASITHFPEQLPAYFNGMGVGAPSFAGRGPAGQG